MATIFPSTLNGSVKAPPSKSCSHRALICAALSDSPCTVKSLSGCDDVMLTKRCLEALGAEFDGETIIPIDRARARSGVILDCGDSGSTLRFLLPIVCALGVSAEFRLSPQLAKRPIAPLCKVLCAHGASIQQCGNTIRMSGKITSGRYELDGSISSQFISGLLMALPLVGGGKVNIIPPIVSANYIDITIDYLRLSNIYVNQIGNTFSVSGDYRFPSRHTVEGDWSAAAFWLCAGAMGLGTIRVDGLSCGSSQGDRRILDILRMMGFSASDFGTVSPCGPCPSRVTVDVSDVPDLFPPLAVLAAAAAAETHFTGTSRLRFKESDRLRAVDVMLTSMGIRTERSNDTFTVFGGKLYGAELSASNDHRIAMAAIIAACAASSPSSLDDISCISKSYPDFIHDFKSLGGQIL